jgi:peroxiredoxin
MRRSIVALGVILGVVSGLVTAGVVRAAPAAPGFSVRLLDSRTKFDSREHIGKHVVVVRFQASWCRPCVKETDALSRVTDRYRARGVEVIALHVQDTVADVRRFVKARQPTYRVAVDPRLAVANRFAFKGTPHTIVIDRKGEIAARLTGRSAVTRLPRVLDEVLRETPRKR